MTYYQTTEDSAQERSNAGTNTGTRFKLATADGEAQVCREPKPHPLQRTPTSSTQQLKTLKAHNDLGVTVLNTKNQTNWTICRQCFSISRPLIFKKCSSFVLCLEKTKKTFQSKKRLGWKSCTYACFYLKSKTEFAIFF